MVSSDPNLAAKLAYLEDKRQSLSLAPTPTLPSSYSATKSAGIGGGALAQPPQASYSSYSSYMSSPSLRTFQKASNGPPSGSGPSPSASAMAAGGGGGKSLLLSPDAYLGNSTKRLVIKSGALTPKAKLKLSLGPSTTSSTGTSGGAPVRTPGKDTSGNASPVTAPGSAASSAFQGASPIPEDSSVTFNVDSSTVDVRETTPRTISPGSKAGVGSAGMAKGQSGGKGKKSPGNESSSSPYNDFYNSITSPTTSSSPAPYLPTLTDPSYTTSPSWDNICSMSEVQLATLKNFSISRPGVGSISWPGAVDVTRVDFDRDVSIEDKEVAVYDDVPAGSDKPEVGEKLNRPALITLENVWQKEGQEEDRFREKLTRVTAKMDAEFISWEDGVWVFKTKHFSRYGLGDDSDDDDDDDEDMLDADKAKAPAVMKPVGLALSPYAVGKRRKPSSVPLIKGLDFRSGDRAGRSPIGAGAALGVGPGGSDVGGEGETFDNDLRRGQDAYGALMAEMDEDSGAPSRVTPTMDLGEDSGKAKERVYTKERPYRPSKERMADVRPRRDGLTSRLRDEVMGGSGMTRRDFYRGGRGAGVAWGPDGRIVQVVDGTSLEIYYPPVGGGGYGAGVIDVHSRCSIAEAREDGMVDVTLPLGLARGGDEESYRLLLNCIDELSKGLEKGSIEDLTFDLVRVLYGQETDPYDPSNLIPIHPPKGPDNDRRLTAFRNYLNRLNMRASNDAVLKFRGNKPEKAIFHALLAGDVAEAVSICVEKGLGRLATIVSSGNMEELVDMQLSEWDKNKAIQCMDPDVVRLYCLLARRTDQEAKLFVGGAVDVGWRGRIGMNPGSRIEEVS